MKHIVHNVHRVELPWYLRPLSLYHYSTRTLRVGLFVVLRFYLERLWFVFPMWLEDYNARECVHFFPDFRHVDGSLGDKIRPFFRMVLVRDEGALIQWRWWRHIVIHKRRT